MSEVPVKKTGYNPADNLPGPGPGRPKGVPNRVTTNLKEAILKAAAAAGGEEGQAGLIEYLTQQAKREPVAFMSLLGRIIPLTLRGDPESPLQVEISNASSKLRTIVEGMAERVEE